MRITKAVLPCPVCGCRNETDEISVSIHVMEEEAETQIIEVNLFCVECRAEYSVKINVGTGQQREDMPPDAKFIGTVVMSYGLVWHCYGKTEVSEK